MNEDYYLSIYLSILEQSYSFWLNEVFVLLHFFFLFVFFGICNYLNFFYIWCKNLHTPIIDLFPNESLSVAFFSFSVSFF